SRRLRLLAGLVERGRLTPLHAPGCSFLRRRCSTSHLGGRPRRGPSSSHSTGSVRRATISPPAPQNHPPPPGPPTGVGTAGAMSPPRRCCPPCQHVRSPPVASCSPVLARASPL